MPDSDDEYSSDDYYDDGDYNADVDSEGGGNDNEVIIKNLPNFITKGSTHVVDKGTTISLPCYVDKMPRKF